MTPIRELSYTPHTPFPLTTPNAAKPTKSEPGDAPSPFARLVRGFAHEADRGEATVNGVLRAGASGVPLDPTSLLALQAGIYRYGETMDLAAQVVDKASTGVKTVVQGQ